MTIAGAAALLTFLIVFRVHISLSPLGVHLRSPGAAHGYGSSLTAICSNLEAYWKLDDSSGTTATDISENSHNGTLQNMADANWSTSLPSGLGFANTNALTFDGTEEYVSVSSDSALQITGDLTLALWVNYDALSSAASGNVLVAHGATGETEATNILYHFGIKSDNTFRLEWESSAGTDTSVESSATATMSASQWYHVAAVRDSTAGEVKFYIGGSLLGSSQSYSTSPTGGTDGSLVLGASADSTNYFDGALDDVRVYTTALTGGQILAIASGTDSFGGCSCGNSSIESPEACDNGGSNSDTVADACRTTCVASSCGDGVTDTGEACDDGSSNSNSTADACRTSCSAASCGDGVTDTGEACDDGNSVNSDSCTNSCAISTCGDEVIQDGEACDDGAANSDTESNACRTTCALPSCGDGVADLGEACDTGGASSTCDTDCTVPVCGDGILNVPSGEACDDGDSNSDTEVDACRTDCTAASCGDGIVDTGDTCDDGNGDNTDACTTLCKPAGCGDGYVQEGNNEECEPPNSGSCASNCTFRTGGGGSSRNRSRVSTTGVTYGDSDDVDDYDEYEELEPPPEGCGNRIMEPEKEEECDEGDRNGRGPCSYYCKLLYCGDGEISPEILEECEPIAVSVLEGIPQFEEPVCGEEACSIPNIDPNTGRVIGGCKRLFLQPCESEDSTAPPPAAEQTSICGNTIQEQGEHCDDGNTENNDGCSSVCRGEMCGDGILQLIEDCDNGSVCANDPEKECSNDLECGIVLSCEENAEGNMTCGGEPDGAPCQSEFDCSFFGKCEYVLEADTSCTSECKRIDMPTDLNGETMCGNGDLDQGEECDDGNAEGGDGCSAFCREEHFCGDGEKDQGEECDDGNAEEGDGCSVLCTLEEEVTQEEPVPAVEDDVIHTPPEEERIYANVCGNQILEEGEECDLGDLNSDMRPDTCRTTCMNAFCGDGTIDFGEQCDTGDANSATRPDSCRMNCVLPRCGDGILDSGEACDGGESCDSFCKPVIAEAVCGNGALELGEWCDDGNTDPGDGCNQYCREEVKIVGVAICGNGVQEGRETCDDGNLFDGDGCSRVCTQEPMFQVQQPEPQTQVAGESTFVEAQFPEPPVPPQIQPQMPQEPAEPMHIVFETQQPVQQVQQVAQPEVPQVQSDAAQYQMQLLAQLQMQQYAEYLQRVIPISVEQTPIGNTGPALLIVVAGGAATGVGIVRRRKRK